MRKYKYGIILLYKYLYKIKDKKLRYNYEYLNKFKKVSYHIISNIFILKIYFKYFKSIA